MMVMKQYHTEVVHLLLYTTHHLVYPHPPRLRWVHHWQDQAFYCLLRYLLILRLITSIWTISMCLYHSISLSPYLFACLSARRVVIFVSTSKAFIMSGWSDYTFFNLGWFGLRKDFCSFLFIICPCLREYANISYNFDLRALTTSSNQQQHRRSSNHNERTTLTSGVQNVVTIGSATDGSERQVTSKKYDLRLKKVVITQQPNQVLTPNVRLDTPD